MTECKCNICKKTFTKENDIFELQEFVHIHFIGGYCSVFGDGDAVHLNMCQHCFKEKLGEYVIVSEYD